MAQQWQVDPSQGRCAHTGREFVEGDEFYTVLFEDGDSFRRVDYAIDAWTEPPKGSFCYFRSRVPAREKKKQLLVDNDMLTNFFLRLADESEPIRVHFRFVLALILLRKRVLRYESTESRDGAEQWQMTLIADKSTHEVVNPRLTDEQIENVSRELGAILHGDMGTWASAYCDESVTDHGASEDAGADA